MAVHREGGVVIAAASSSDALANARAAAERLAADLRAELEGILAAQEADPPDDEHDVEGSSIGFERARVTALLATAEEHLAELRAADERLAAGSYGRCEVCGQAIGEDRLVAMPTTRRCISCATPARRGLRR